MRDLLDRFWRGYAAGSALLLVAICCLPSVRAQSMVATSSQPTGGSNTLRQVREGDAIVREMARCVISRAASQARFLLGTVPGSDQEARVVSTMNSRMDWCMPPRSNNRGVGFPFAMFRGVLAEQLIAADFPGGMGATHESPEDLSAWQIAYAKQAKGDIGRMAMEQSARCVVVREPTGVSNLIASAPFGDEEAASIAKLKSTLSGCLNTGTTARLSRQTLRGFLAEALYEYAAGERTGFGKLDNSGIEKK